MSKTHTYTSILDPSKGKGRERGHLSREVNEYEREGDRMGGKKGLKGCERWVSFSPPWRLTKLLCAFNTNGGIENYGVMWNDWLWVQVLIELSAYSEKPVTESEGRAVGRRIGAVSYVECSALTQHNLKHVFDVAVMAALVKRGAKKTTTRSANGFPSSSPPPAVRRRSHPAHQQTPNPSRWWKRPFSCCCA